MTQKELLYYEDAIEHEDIIVKLIDKAILSLTDEKLIDFMEEEKNKHTELKNALMHVLKEEANG